MVSDFPAGDGNISNLFLQCIYTVEHVVQIYNSKSVHRSSFADLNCYKLNSADAVQYWRNVTGRIDCITNCRTLSGKKDVFVKWGTFLKELFFNTDLSQILLCPRMPRLNP